MAPVESGRFDAGETGSCSCVAGERAVRGVLGFGWAVPGTGVLGDGVEMERGGMYDASYET